MKNIKYIFLAIGAVFCTTALFAQSAVTELNFYKKESQSEDKKLLEALDNRLGAWLDKNYSLPSADDALVLKASVEARTKNYPAAFITLLRQRYEFPNSANTERAKEIFSEVLQKSPKAEQDALVKAYAIKSVPKNAEDRLAEFLSAATRLELKGTYSPLEAEYKSFFARFPVYENKDKVELLLGDLERSNRNYQAAVMQYQKVYDIYPSTKYKAASLRMLGDIYAGELKDYEKADYYYDSVITKFPNSIEIATTYHHRAILNDNRRNYHNAAENINKAAEIYLKNGQRQKAYDAYLYKADLQNKRLKDFAGAADTLNKTAQIFQKEPAKFNECKLLAAEIYSRKLKDDYGQLKAYQDIMANYPASAEAAQATYEAGMINEKLGNINKAEELYKKLIVEHPADVYANKAQKRLNKIEKLKAQGLAAAKENTAAEPAPKTQSAAPSAPAPKAADNDEADEEDIVLDVIEEDILVD